MKYIDNSQGDLGRWGEQTLNPTTLAKEKVYDILLSWEIDRNSPAYQLLNPFFEAWVSMSELAMTLDKFWKDFFTYA